MAQLEHLSQKGEEGLAFVCAEAMAVLPDCCKGLRKKLATQGTFGDVTRTLDETGAEDQHEAAGEEVVPESSKTIAVDSNELTGGLPEAQTTVSALFCIEMVELVVCVTYGWG